MARTALFRCQRVRGVVRESWYGLMAPAGTPALGRAHRLTGSPDGGPTERAAMKNRLIAVLRRIRALMAWLWRALDAGRRIAANLLLLAMLVGGVVTVVALGSRGVERHSVLVLELEGPLVEEPVKGLRQSALQQLRGEEAASVRLRDLVEALEKAAGDDRIDRVLLLLDGFEGAGLASLREAAAAIEAFKASGKPVIAWGSAFDQRQYYLAAHASEVLMHPLGMVRIEGMGRQRNYYRDALDRLGIRANLIRVGQYKSAGEPWVANRPSEQALKAEAHVYDAIWALYTEGIERARRLPAGSVMRGIDALPGALVEVKGDAARLAVDGKLVDGLQPREEVRQRLMKEVGSDDEGKTFRQIGLTDYLKAVRKPVRGDHIAVVVAQGEISDGDAPSGRIGGQSTARLIRSARLDDAVKAVVLRVNSPGGSAFGSELVREELARVRAAGKPVVVSMGDVAASGGYWISLAADRVIAEPSTITGSIGVFALLPTAEGLMGKLSVNTGGHRTTWLAGAYDVRQSLDPRFEALVQSGIGHVYQDFIRRTAAARKSDPATIEAVAQGRIWTGRQALDAGLVDAVGSFGDALAHARQLAGAALPVRYAQPPTSMLDTLFERLTSRLTVVAQGVFRTEMPAGSLLSGGPVAQALAADLQWLSRLLEGTRPFEAAAHCLCQVGP